MSFYFNQGCHGGDSANANAYMAEMGITDETCSIYRYQIHEIREDALPEHLQTTYSFGIEFHSHLLIGQEDMTMAFHAPT